MTTSTTSEHLETIRSIMKDSRIAMLTSIDVSGALHSHPMTFQDAEFDGDCWFLAADGSDPVQHIEQDSRVNVSYAASTSWLSLAGKAHVVRDRAKKQELWNTFTEAWFTDGESDPSVVLIHVTAESAQYWDSPGRLATMVSMLKAAVTKEEPDAGQSAALRL